MKKLAILSILFISLAFVVPAPALAQTDAGPTPGSFWYGITTTFENVNLFFTFNSEKKAEKALGYAERRLTQAKAAAESENSKALEIALTDYEAKIALASESSKKIKDNERAEKLLTSIADNTSRHQEVLSGVLEKVPEEAREAIVRAIEASKRGQEEANRQNEELKREIERLKAELVELKAENENGGTASGDHVPASVNTPAPTPKPVEIQKREPEISTVTLSNSQIIKKVKPAVVYIETDAGTGSGMVISSDGFVLTNAHVVQNSATAQITLSSGSIYLASVIGRDENVDLAVLKINAQNLAKVEFGDSNGAEQGDEVFTLGYPFGIKGDVSFKEGTISRKIAEGTNTYLETSAEIHPGNSGGPLVNATGNVIGVNSSSFGQSIRGIAVGETIKFAIPINIAKNLIPELKAGRQVIVPKTETPSVGDPFQTEDSNLKIAKCQAEARAQADNMKQLLYKQAEDGFGKNIADAEEGIRKSKLEQLEKMSEFDESLLGLSPEQQASIRESRAAAVQPTIDYYVSMKQKNLRLLEEAKNTIDRSVEQAYNELYLKCINK